MKIAWPELPRGHTTVSPSALEDWTCPRRGRHRHVLHLPEPASYPATMGRLLHETVRRYLLHCAVGGFPADPPAADELAWAVFWDPAERHGLAPAAFHDLAALAGRFAARWETDVARIAHVEEPWQLPLGRGRPADDDLAKVWLRIIPDVVYLDREAADVYDFKTGWRIRGQDDVAEDIQLGAYAWSVAQRYPHLREIRGHLYFVRYGETRSVTYGAESLETAGRMLREGYRRIRALRKRRRYPAVPGPESCRLCGYAARCPAADGAVAVATRSPAEAAEAAAALAAVERRRADLRAAVSTWTEHRGPVQAGGEWWGHEVGFRERIRPTRYRTLRQRLDRAGFDPDAFFKPDEAKVRDLIRYHLPMVADLLEETASTRFGRMQGKGR